MFKNPSNFFQQVLSSSVYTKPIKSRKPPLANGGIPQNSKTRQSQFIRSTQFPDILASKERRNGIHNEGGN
jgi:hypothetical protein